jgi:aryl-alcohol dehydrogenase-like predicted oxidoreductase
VLELAMSCLAAQPTVGSVIAGARNATQLRSNTTCADWALDADDLLALDDLLAVDGNED